MTHFEDLIYTLNWILDTELSDNGTADTGASKLVWHLDVLESDDFGAELQALPEKFVVRIYRPVWPRLDAFCICGIDWEAKARKPRSKAFNYSKAEWETLIQLTQDKSEWSSIEAKVQSLEQNSTCKKRVLVPLSVYAANGMKVHTAAACYGIFWLLCHEGTHAWKQHHKLQEIDFRELIQNSSPLLAGAELERTCEAEADWQSTKFVFSSVLNCVVAGYNTALAYAAGFGTAAAILMLNPSRHNVWAQAEHHDPGWMRLHLVQGAAKAGGWSITEAYYPEYVAMVRQHGAGGVMRNNSNKNGPSSRFFERSRKTLEAFSLGLHHAMRYAQALSDANELHHIADRQHFKFGDPDEWKAFQIMVMETDVLKRRERARNELRRRLPPDPRFRGFALGYDALLRMSFLAAKKRAPIPGRVKSRR